MVAPFERGLQHGGSQRATALAERMEERGLEIEWRVVRPGPVTPAVRARATVSLRPTVVQMYPRAPAASPPSDVVVAAHSYLAPQLRAAGDCCVRVIDFHNLEWRHLLDSARFAGGVRQVNLRLQARLMRRFERRAIEGADLCLFTDRAELEWAARTGAETDMLIVPNLLPRADEQAALDLGRHRGAPDPYQLLYLGTVRFPPNLGALVRFLSDAWPAIKLRVPAARLTIAGDCDCATRAALSAHPGVEAVGFVDDVGPLLRRSAAVVMPIEGEAGTSLRAIYLALAGKGVIGTATAFRGLAWRMGVVVDSPQAWARAVEEVVASGDANGADIAAARDAALAHQRDPRPWDELFRRLAERTERP